MEARKLQLDQRQKELTALINELEKNQEQPGSYLGIKHHMNSLDMSKLVLSGHSFGGITALNQANVDSRVKATFTFDPWMFIHSEKILKDEWLVKQPMAIIQSETFGSTLSYPMEEVNTSLVSQNENSLYAAVKGCDHHDQTDVPLVIPLEIGASKLKMPKTNHHELLMVHS